MARSICNLRIVRRRQRGRDAVNVLGDGTCTEAR